MRNLLYNQCEQEIMALTILGEARGEYHTSRGGLAAMIAIGNVIKNRSMKPHLYGLTIKEVCLKKWQFSCWNHDDPNFTYLNDDKIQADPLYDIAITIATNVINNRWPDLTKGSNHYYAQWLKKIPHWAHDKVAKIQIGQHLFFNL